MYPAPQADSGDWNPTWLNREEAEFTSSMGNRLHGWYCEHAQPRAVILLCHGNGEHVAFMAEELRYLRDRFQASILAFDYRGYGKSEGQPFEAGILADGLAAQRWLSERAGVPESSIVIWGRSLGGAVAVHLAASNGAKGLVLDRTFSSMVDVAASHYPWLPVRMLLSDRYPSSKRIEKYHGPIIQIHGKVDQVVPFQFGRALFDNAPSVDKRFLALDDLHHNDPWPEETYLAVEQFITSL